MQRWAIYIDIEGFSALWEKETRVLASLGKLMKAIFRIGRLCFPEAGERLFVHQIGDGFFIVSDGHEASLERALSITIALMRHVAATGRLARAAIAEGDNADITGRYPREVMDAKVDNRVSLGMGLMKLFPVLGTALIRSSRAAKASPKGPLLVLPKSFGARLGDGVDVISIPNSHYVTVDWVHLESSMLTEIQRKAQLKSPLAAWLEQMLNGYCSTYELPEEWIRSVRDHLHVPKA
jgi:hypothetical protein